MYFPSSVLLPDDPVARARCLRAYHDVALLPEEVTAHEEAKHRWADSEWRFAPSGIIDAINADPRNPLAYLDEMVTAAALPATARARH